MYGNDSSGMLAVAMFAFLLLLFPLTLLALPLLMERVERSLREPGTIDLAIPDQAGMTPGTVPTQAATTPGDLEGVTGTGYAPAVKRYWGRGRLTALRPQRSAVRG